MAKWILICVKCKTEFQHSQVSDVGMASLFLPGKTEDLPSSKSTYPSCGYTGTYRRTAVSWLITELNGCGGLEGP
jgi:hypothetical protein